MLLLKLIAIKYNMKKREELKYLLLTNELSDSVFKKQKETFWFSLFIMDLIWIKKTLKNIIDNKTSILSKVGSLFLIPHVYIFPLVFWGLALNFFFSWLLWAPFIWFWESNIYYFKRFLLDLSLYAAIILIIFSISKKVFKQISVKMWILYESLFMVDKTEDEVYSKLDRLTKLDSNKKKNNWFSKISDWMWVWPIFMFLFSQPFIFWHWYWFWGFSILALIIFDLFIFLIIFKKLSVVIFYISLFYYKIKFTLMDYFPFMFWRKIKERNFYLKLYKKIHKLDFHLTQLNENISLIKEWTIDSDLWEGLWNSIKYIWLIYDDISDSSIMERKWNFKIFLKDLLNESIDEYISIFKVLENMIEDNKLENTIYTGVTKIKINSYNESLKSMKDNLIKIKI